MWLVPQSPVIDKSHGKLASVINTWYNSPYPFPYLYPAPSRNFWPLDKPVPVPTSAKQISFFNSRPSPVTRVPRVTIVKVPSLFLVWSFREHTVRFLKSKPRVLGVLSTQLEEDTPYFRLWWNGKNVQLKKDSRWPQNLRTLVLGTVGASAKPSSGLEKPELKNPTPVHNV